MKTRKIPMRKCMGCQEMKNKKELIRIVRSPEGAVTLDLKGRAPGRGAYLCRSSECLKRALKSKALERVFSMKIEENLEEALRQEVEAYP